jgi:hypothetical protein
VLRVQIPESSRIIDMERKWPGYENLGPESKDDWVVSEVDLLKVKPDDVAWFEPLSSRLDVWYYERAFDAAFDDCEQRAVDPEMGRYVTIVSRMESEGIIVFKQGATTGLTMGKLSELHFRALPG